MPNPTVSELYVYPVKSLRGQPLDAAEVTPRGLRHDRQWMIVDEDGSFLTQRVLPRMCLVAAAVHDDALVLTADNVPVLTLPTNGLPGPERCVTVWRDKARAVDQGDEAAEWLERQLGVECRLVRMADDHIRSEKSGKAQVGFADAYPFLVISNASLEDLNARLERPLPMNRFRPNIVVDGVQPYAEDTWDTVQAGELLLRGAARCERCATTTTDQDTAQRGVEPLRTLATYRRTPDGAVTFGRNFIHANWSVTVRVGDPIRPQPLPY